MDKEQYLLHADGRDEGLRDIDPDSPEAYAEWYHHRQRGGHPWEVCRGGNSTHVALYVYDEEDVFLYALFNLRKLLYIILYCRTFAENNRP